MLKSFKIYTCTNGSLGLHLSRAPWDPYPWVSSIQKESTSYAAGLRVGDCLLELNGSDVLGLKISEIAGLLKNHWLNESSNHVNVVIWRNKAKDTTMDASDADDVSDEDEENNAHNINQQSLQKFATCLQHIAQLLECPVCLEVVKPPGWQCCNGHVLCNNCRSRSEKCPVCRVPLGPRGRCLLSDKLFTLLAESFPCDGVRSNKNSPKDRRKCSTEFHSQPKMAIVQKQLQDQLEDDDAKAKDFKKTEHEFILRSLRIGRRRRTKSKKDDAEDGHQLQRQQSLQGVLNAVVQIKCDDNSSRKLSQDFCRSGVTSTATLGQVSGGSYSDGPLSAPVPSNSDELLDARYGLRCHCRMCYKPTKEVAIVNNVMTATTMPNKYILQVQAEQQMQHHPHHRQELQCGLEKYQNYQCPTGKLCCLQLKNVMSPHALSTATQVDTASYQVQQVHQQQQQQHLHVHQPMTNNNLPTTCSSGGGDGGHLYRTLQNEWEILAHLTQDHQSAVNQYYAEFGQRIAITHDVLHDKSVICLNLRGRGGDQPQNTNIEKFFVAFVPLAEEQQHNCHPQPQPQNVTTNSNNSAATKVAVFVWHMNALPNCRTLDGHSDTLSSPGDVTGDCDDEVSNFDAIIENPKTGIKWFGRAHCLTTPWSQIYHKQHFLMHEVMEKQITTTTTETPATAALAADDAFVIVIKEKS